MDDDKIEGSGVLSLVREELARLASSVPEAVLEVEASLDEALRELEDDGEIAGAIALATLLELATTFDQRDFKELLSDFSEILSQEVNDVGYVNTSIDGSKVFHLSEYLPVEAPPRMRAEDRQTAEAFVEKVIRPSASDPDSDPGPGPRPPPGPRRRRGPG